MIVRLELEKLGLYCTIIEFGRVETMGTISAEKISEIKIALLRYGLEVMDDKKSILVEKIKNLIIEMVHYSDGPLKINFSNYLSSKLNLDYTYLSNIFSEIQGTTIEHFIIGHKIGRVKTLMAYNDLNLTEISWKLHYSSVAHLSAQFKKVTGLTPSQFKQLSCQDRLELEDVGII
ncbi:MAG: transcriptional regulator, AraC family [Mucilaginibacter sp.]|nr:transcriptional regulator, AraC family [Mucilaginibacter sp.]